MKKFVAAILAVCMVLSLSVSAFAGSVTLEWPDLSQSDSYGKDYYSATDANGNDVRILAAYIDENSTQYDAVKGIYFKDVYAEVKDYGVIAFYRVTLLNEAVTGTVTLDLYAAGASKDSIVIVRDDWTDELAEVAAVNGNRAKIAIDAADLRKYCYIAVVKTFKSDDAVDVNPPSQDTDNENDPDDGEGDNMNVDDGNDGNGGDNGDEGKNPPTGIVLAVVPMMVAAAAAVVSKRR